MVSWRIDVDRMQSRSLPMVQHPENLLTPLPGRRSVQKRNEGAFSRAFDREKMQAGDVSWILYTLHETSLNECVY